MEGKDLKLIIESRGIKQAFLAKKLGISKALVNQWTKGLTPIADKHKIELKSLLNPVN